MSVYKRGGFEKLVSLHIVRKTDKLELNFIYLL